ncbi:MULTISPECIES: MBL fold metallo-hydrolase [Rummeliibacillus]|jgi:glyoxylase-like metal-dependent hydrolase (beta-lactamase superfamily II)|uniref:MBL fold metallo-hydrolase n=1 Tax=Rummeliibacillus TaxID=648802 RepID=UPI0011B4DF1B|nr:MULTISPECIES: MBL fold metallo-hydrolase [Rummeliibacillus]MBO2536870.1 MBL fold metallo-hydrolase [Rummeliibacillus suwonensis]
MKISHFKNIYQITIMPRVFPVNCYIIEEQNELTVIDAGIPASFKGIVKVIEQLNKPLTNIVLTHAHEDHIGSLEHLKEQYPAACVSISIRDSRLLKGDRSLDAHEPQMPIKGGVPKNLQIVPDRLLKEGDTIGSLEVVETPGHTPGSISLFVKNTKAMIVGDALQTKGKVAVSGQFVLLFPFPTLATWNKELALKSAKKILNFNPSLLAVGHGEMIEDPEAVIQIAIKEAEKNLVYV